mgnify:CR=1 FL=1
MESMGSMGSMDSMEPRESMRSMKSWYWALSNTHQRSSLVCVFSMGSMWSDFSLKSVFQNRFFPIIGFSKPIFYQIGGLAMSPCIPWIPWTPWIPGSLGWIPWIPWMDSMDPLVSMDSRLSRNCLLYTSPSPRD